MRAPLPVVLPLLAAFVLAGQAQAEPTLNGVNLGEYAAGPRVTPKDLRGRVVVFEYWGNSCPPCKKAIPHVAALQAKYPYQALIVVANQCWEGDAAETGKIWAANGGGAKVAVIHKGNLPGARMKGVPHVFVFDAAGKQVFSGHPAAMDDAVAKAVKESPAGKTASAERERAKQVFGDQVVGGKMPEELVKLALQAADTTRSSESVVKSLKMAAGSKNPKFSEPAKDMLASFDKCVAARIEALPKLAETEPAAAWAQMEMLGKWVPQEGAKIAKQKAEWLRDSHFLKELAADKAWLALKAQADKIGFDKNPKAKPTSQLESDYKKLLKDKDTPGTKGLGKAKAAADGWKLDPETGRADKWKPRPATESASNP